ncbi:cleft lip and palate transmembrane protein 1-like protein [Centruroides sculpturatus]|uniref:cleft lip and palate transmembrane protein 1-like protein n=2 Tax=Centruroides sculpturatus TaxID=218467 RepID=UPI000C6E151E|nr:cleft lip and palate transmembrane protein 1-like protein [Centruroides sculpturatus]
MATHEDHYSYQSFDILTMTESNTVDNGLVDCNGPIFLCTSPQSIAYFSSDLVSVWSNNNFDISQNKEIELNVTLPSKTLNNGSLYLHVYMIPLQTTRKLLDLNSIMNHAKSIHGTGSLTEFQIQQAEVFSLLKKSEDEKKKSKKKKSRVKPISHWKSHLTLHMMSEPIPLFLRSIPGEIANYLKITGNKQYCPIIHISKLSYKLKDLVPINSSQSVMPLTIAFTPITIGRLRLMVIVEHAMDSLLKMGFTDKDTDEIKGIFFDTSIYLLLLTIFVSAFHLLFDFLAFKNDISFWRKRTNMVGLSYRTLIWRCVSQAIVFLYLLDEETSLLVLIPMGIAAVIELWKVTKASKMNISWIGWKPKISFGSTSNDEKETAMYDSQSMKYLSYLLYPLCLGGAVYSLFYVPQKSWYSWCIHSLVNGVYAFGFLFMLPQLFVNYKLKSVAHLPWRSFMYKAFNTFIDDLFAFIITMPIAHRVACFRDDIVFLVYLYQRWLYPVDTKRVEFGESMVEGKSDKQD